MNRDSNDKQAVKLTGEEVAKHTTKDDCWVIVHGKGKSSTSMEQPFDITNCFTSTNASPSQPTM
jgi:hypothetical protein